MELMSSFLKFGFHKLLHLLNTNRSLPLVLTLLLPSRACQPLHRASQADPGCCGLGFVCLGSPVCVPGYGSAPRSDSYH